MGIRGLRERKGVHVKVKVVEWRTDVARRRRGVLPGWSHHCGLTNTCCAFYMGIGGLYERMGVQDIV